MCLRCPIAPGFNDREDHFAGIAAPAAATPGVQAVQLMPYHAIGVAKYTALGIPSGTDGLATVDRRTGMEWLAAVRAAVGDHADLPIGLG